MMAKSHLVAPTVRCAVYCLCIVASIGSTSAQPTPRQVFAHYMVCCSLHGHGASVDELEAEMRTAMRSGIDGFALNCGAWRSEDLYADVAERMFEAADRIGGSFKLFFSVDSAGKLSPQEVTEMVARFGGRPSYLRVNGRSVVSTFHGSVAWDRSIIEGLAANGTPIFFIPNLTVPSFLPFSGFQIETPTKATVDRLAEDTKDEKFDGLFYFGAAGRYRDIAMSTRAFGDAMRVLGRAFMAPVTPYYRGLGANFRVFESDGFRGMQAEWLAAIESGAQWVEIVTWNDWGEATYVQPFGGADKLNIWSGHWGELLAHDGFLGASRYYIDWFKNGQPPTIKRNQVFYFYRVHPKSIKGFRIVGDREQGQPTHVDTLEDNVWLVGFLTNPALIIAMVGDKEEVVNMDAGISTRAIKAGEGKVVLEIHQANRIMRFSPGLDISSKNTFGNFNYYSGEINF